MFEKIFITPSGKFFLLLGLFLLFLGIASVVQVLVMLPFAGISSFNDIAKIENLLSDMSNPGIVQGMKIAQALSAVLAFIVPSFLFAYLVPPKSLPDCVTSEDKQVSSPKGRTCSTNPLPFLPPSPYPLSFGEGQVVRWRGAFSYLKINKGFIILLLPVIIILVFAAMPVINFTGELNSHLSLPDFLSGLENSMRESEDRMKVITDAFLQMNGIGDLLINILVIALLAAVGEELLFRGCFQNILVQWTKNIHIAIWLTAILFSALHFQFYGFLPRMLLGVLLGYLYVWSGSLWLPILFHFLNNGLAVLFAYLIGKGLLTENAETVGVGESELMFVFISAALSAWLMYFVWRRKIQDPDLKGESEQVRRCESERV